MDFYKNLPAPLRIAIPAVLVLIVAFFAYSTMLKQPAPVAIMTTKDVGIHETAKDLLKTMDVTESEDGDTFTLMVPAADATDAKRALAAAGIKDRTGLASQTKCPAAPGFTSNNVAKEKYYNCEDATEVQKMLLAAGVIAAKVKVSKHTSESLLGEEKLNVSAQVFLPERMKETWNAEQAARVIASAVGTDTERVIISDGDLQMLFDGSAKGASDAAASGVGEPGCSDMETAREVETKTLAVRNCYEQTIGEKLTKLLGSEDRYVLTVEPTIETAATTTTAVRNTRGPVVDSNKQKGGGSSISSETVEPSTSETTSQKPAGSIKSMRLNVALDQATVDKTQMEAVKQLLAPYVKASRNDPAPVVTLTKLAASNGAKADAADIEKLRAEAEAAAKPSSIGGGATLERSNVRTPAWMTATIAVLAIGIFAAVLLLWRRSAAMAAERARMEQSFQNDQRLFENFAQQNPDDLAADLASLFGQPSAQQQPTYQ